MIPMLSILFWGALCRADDLGLEQFPEQPSSKHLTWDKDEFRELFPEEIGLPAVLIPWDYDVRARVMTRRYFDEAGNVYSYQQVEQILRRCRECREELRDFLRAKNKSDAWSVGGLVSVIVFFPGLIVCLPMSMIALRETNEEFEDVLEVYNVGGNWP